MNHEERSLPEAEKGGWGLKTVIEEEVISSTTQVKPQEQKGREAAAREVRFEQKPKPAPARAQSSTDCYESCLDLSALFLPRG